MIIFNEGRVKI